MTNQLPSQEELKKLFEYDPLTGLLFWKIRGGQYFQTSWAMNKWNTRYAGKPALMSLSNNGYRYGNLFNKKVRAHRIIWKLTYGYDPKDIDHINGDRTDNRINNLRSVSRSDNMRNTKRHVDSPCPIPGVSWEKSRSKWMVRVCFEHLGRFDCLGEALKVRRSAEGSMNFHENHGRSA